MGLAFLFALLAAVAAWIVGLLCGLLGAPAWLTTILVGATLVFVFWALLGWRPAPRA
jgi:predicted permease